jgi:hypothetical protein
LPNTLGELQTKVAKSLMQAKVIGRAIVGLLVLASNSPSLAGSPLRVWLGSSGYGKVILTVDGSKVHRGDSPYGPVIFTIEGNRIREGDSAYGQVVASVGPNGRVHLGDSPYGKTIATVNGGQVREGDAAYGETIATTEGGQMTGAAAATFLLLR